MGKICGVKKAIWVAEPTNEWVVLANLDKCVSHLTFMQRLLVYFGPLCCQRLGIPCSLVKLCRDVI